MARKRLTIGNPTGRRPAFRGVLMHDVSQGKERFRVWAKKRGKPKTTAEREANLRFAMAQLATKYISPTQYADWINATNGTPLLPRDMMTAMFYGRLLAFRTMDRKVLWPMAARTSVEEALDIITQTIGDVLLRTANGWEGTPIAALGGGGGGLWPLTARNTGNISSTTTNYCRGPHMVADADVYVKGASMILHNNNQYTCSLFHIDGSNVIDEILAEVGPLTGGSGQPITYEWDAVQLLSGERYGLTFTATSGTSQMSFRGGGTQYQYPGPLRADNMINWSNGIPAVGEQPVYQGGTSQIDNCSLLAYV